jgi:hypothetical protein
MVYRQTAFHAPVAFQSVVTVILALQRPSLTMLLGMGPTHSIFRYPTEEEQVVPILMIFFFAQRYFVQGITLTGLKA